MAVSLTIDLRTPSRGYFGTQEGGVPGGAYVTIRYDREVRDANGGDVPAPAADGVVVSGTVDPIVPIPFANDDASLSDDSQGFAILINARWMQDKQLVTWSKTVAIDSSYGSAVSLSSLPGAQPVPPQYMTVAGVLAIANDALTTAQNANAGTDSGVAGLIGQSGSQTQAAVATEVDAHLGGDSTGLVTTVAGKVAKGDLLVNVRDYGAKADGVTDDGPAGNRAIAAVVAAGGGVVYWPAGTYLIKTVLNLSNIHPLAYHYNQDAAVIMRGAGRHATLLTGGESAFGLIEMVGSNRITIESISLQATGTIQYAILAGRTTGDGSSGEHTFRDLSIYGSFTLAGIFAMSSEINTYERMFVYATKGTPIILAREQSGYTVSAKYTPLSSTAIIGGGNGLNRFSQVQLYSISTTATDYALILEYVQEFAAENLYTFSTGITSQILMRKLCMGAHFKGLQQEYSGTAPLGFYFSATGASPSSPDYRGVHIQSSRALSIYGETGTRLAELNVDGTEWRAATTWQIDVDTLYDSQVRFDARATSTAAVVSNPQYRVRTTSRANQWGPNDTAPLTAPTITLGTTNASGGTFTAGTYYWVVTATNSYGETIASNQVSATLAANGTQVINWSATTGATGYKVYRSTTSGSFTGSTRVGLLGAVTTFTDTGGAPAAASPPAVATAGRPSAAYRGFGAQMFDTYLGKPIWSNGSAWVDATGATV